MTHERCDEILEECRALRGEIVTTKNARLSVLGFTITALVATGGVIADSLGPGQPFSYRNYVLVLFCLVIINAAVVLTRFMSQLIDRIAGYIRTFIETELGGIQWEGRWQRFREDTHREGRVRFGTSRVLAWYYAFLLLIVLGIATATLLSAELYYAAPIVILGLADIWVIYDLFARRGSGWRVCWLETENAQQRHKDAKASGWSPSGCRQRMRGHFMRQHASSNREV